MSIRFTVYLLYEADKKLFRRMETAVILSISYYPHSRIRLKLCMFYSSRCLRHLHFILSSNTVQNGDILLPAKVVLDNGR